MRVFRWIACGAMLLPGYALSQTAGAETLLADVSTSADPTADSGSSSRATTRPEFVPMTMSERSRYYLLKAVGPAAILRSVTAGAFAQRGNTPKEWGQGAQAYGERVGNALAVHIIRESLEFGASTALHEDNRYVPSTDRSFFKRTRYAVGAIFIAHNAAGSEHFAYSRVGSVLGSAFISRLWQPRSQDSAGSAMVSFGLTMATDIGWNVFREFSPSLGKHFRKH